VAARTARDNYLRRRYGITEAEYEAILKAQKGVCWICSKPPKKRRQETRKRVRGLLCWACNGAISKFKDDPVRLSNAAKYCKQWPAQKILKGGTDGNQEAS
jgi:hypothetical protein